MNLGPLMLDLDGDLSLSSLDRKRLRHPSVGGVILFSRNYRDPAQLGELTKTIRDLRDPPLMIAVDQEGGRVQRFQDGFTRLPCAATYGALFDGDKQLGLDCARAGGYVMAAELRQVGVDFSFAPVLDVALVTSEVIGDRAFHADPRAVSQLAEAWITGMNEAGMAATGKHFPGHGGVAGDSHECLPCDDRAFEDLRRNDLKPYQALIPKLGGIMTAHVVFEAIDPRPATFSKHWLQSCLREGLYYDGVVFSDDLGMAGALGFGDGADRARQALDAGCDMILICNDSAAANAMLDAGLPSPDAESAERFEAMRGQDTCDESLLRAARETLSANM